MSKNNKRRAVDEALQLLTSYIALSDEAVAIAEGWSILPPRAQRHIKILIDDHIAQLSPDLAKLYENTSGPDQLRFNALIEEFQRSRRPSGDPNN